MFAVGYRMLESGMERLDWKYTDRSGKWNCGQALIDGSAHGSQPQSHSTLRNTDRAKVKVLTATCPLIELVTCAQECREDHCETVAWGVSWLTVR